MEKWVNERVKLLTIIYKTFELFCYIFTYRVWNLSLFNTYAIFWLLTCSLPRTVNWSVLVRILVKHGS